MSRKLKSIKATFSLAIAVLAALVMQSGSAEARSYREFETRNIVIIGDRALDIAYNLGVVPAGISARCSMWPLCDRIRVVSQPLKCPGCLSSGKTEKLVKFIKSKGVKLALVEKSKPFCILQSEADPMSVLPLLEKLGVEAKVVDFSQGLISAINQTANVLGKQDVGKILVAKYEKAVKKLDKKISGQKLGKRVVILYGVYQAETGKTFLRVEAPGGYTDKYLLEPLGCTNVGDALVHAGKKASKGFWTIRKLKGLAKAKPDVIAITGDSAAVQRALAKEMANNSALAAVPAYSLPTYIDSSVIERPQILSKWFWALK